MRPLTEAEIATVKGMLRRGDRQQDVAYYYGVPQSTINRIKKGRMARARPIAAATENLPPSGPYKLYPVAVIDTKLVEAEAYQIAVRKLEELLAELKQRGAYDAVRKV